MLSIPNNRILPRAPRLVTSFPGLRGIAIVSLDVDTDGGKIKLGIEYLAQIAEALGSAVAGEYIFVDKHLYARHYRHSKQDEFDLPKLFISELVVEELPDAIAQLIYRTVNSNTVQIRVDPP